MRKKYLKWGICIATLVFLLIISVLLSLSVGEIHFSIAELIDILTKKQGVEYTIVSHVRLPRVLLGLAVGGSLSLSGVILQGIYRNPLVEPYTMGISGGAALGVALAIVFGFKSVFGVYTIPFSGFSGALITVFLVYFMSLRNFSINVAKMLLIGVMISFIASSGMMFLMSTTSTDNLHSIVFWIMGSLDNSDYFLVKTVLFTSLAGLLFSYFFANQLNALRLGESRAKHLGINTSVSIRVLFLITSLLTGISVSVAGVIGFVGLIIPHLLRMIVGSDFRPLLISSFLGGAVFIVLCDVVARTIIAPNELPIGVITGLIGGVVFIFALSKSNNLQSH